MTDTPAKIRPPRYTTGVPVQIGDEVLEVDGPTEIIVVVAIYLDQVEVSTGDMLNPAYLALLRRPA